VVKDADKLTGAGRRNITACLDPRIYEKMSVQIRADNKKSLVRTELKESAAR
jgi:hypothetical protein